MIKRVLVSILCLIMICTCIGIGSAEALEAANGTEEDLDLEYLQHYVKWDASREPDDYSITEEEYLAALEKDQNENGILDILEDDDEVTAAAIQTGILGDLNGDGYVDNKDVVLLYRHIAGWNQDINSDKLDFNGDGYVNYSDANHLLQYVSGWPDIVLYSGKKYDIDFHLYPEGMYVPEEGITNPNPDYYYSSEGLSLKNVSASGYIFEGWYDGEGESATRIRKIEVGETGEIELYARWTPRAYKIDFDSEFVEVESKYYTIETGAILSTPSLSNYIFVGWTNQDDGRLVKAVPKGTYGNLTLIANWASRRNLAKPVGSLGDPIIAEDTEAGKIVFIYHIGDIENVPLFTLYRFSTAEGITSSVTLTKQTSISSSDAQTISETVANATTDSATWTLSEGWNESTNVTEESAKQAGITREEAETSARSSTNTYRLDTSRGSSKVVSDSSQHTFNIGGSVGGSKSTTDEDGWKNEFSVDANYEREKSAGINLEDIINVGSKSTFGIGAHAGGEKTHKHTETSTSNWGVTLDFSSGHTHTKTSTKSWNNTSSFSNSNTMSSSRTTSEQISELITNRYGYGYSYSKNGTQSSGQSFVTENSQQNAYSNTVTYNTSELCSEVTSYTVDGKMDGYYRQVLAGTAHVFSVVGYDVATCSYFVYTYTVMDDETYEFLDYSKTTPNFNDNEIGVIPFEIPFFVNEYVNTRIVHSSGLEININTGTVTDYDGDDPVVVVPSYVDVDNGDGTYSSVKITGIESKAFQNNKTLQGIMLSEFVREIPDSAFEGCSNLRDVYIPGLTSIGNRAFYGCTSLSKLTIPTDVASLGTDAFYNVNDVEIIAANKNVALAAVSSGAKSLVLNIASIEEAMDNTEFEAPPTMDVFEIQGERKDYTNLRVKSYAGRTSINGINFVDCVQVPLELHSSTVDLNQTTASGSGYCMIIAADNCELNLFGTNRMNSSGANAIVCANTTLANSNSSVQALLEVTGNIYVCGSISNDRYLSLKNGNIIYISQEEYNKYINGVYQLKFDANGGSVEENERVAYSGASIGSLPTPTRTGYTFVGWYTAPSGGVQVSASSTFISSSSVTVYALWSPISSTVSFDGNGGTASTDSMSVSYDSTYGSLATATRTGYSFNGWYTAASGGTKIESSTTVTTASDHTLYAHWTVNSYTYSIVYKSSNGTSLGSSSATYQFGTTNTITPPSKSGYNTPDAQSVTWDATSKTITFTYSPSSVSNATTSGTLSTSPGITYSVEVQYRNRTANSVEVRVVWKNTIKAGSYNTYQMCFSGSCGGASISKTEVVGFGDWKSSSNSARTKTGTSSWVTVSLNTTNQTTASAHLEMYQYNANGTNMYNYSGTPRAVVDMTVKIPAY